MWAEPDTKKGGESAPFAPPGYAPARGKGHTEHDDLETQEFPSKTHDIVGSYMPTSHVHGQGGQSINQSCPSEFSFPARCWACMDMSLSIHQSQNCLSFSTGNTVPPILLMYAIANVLSVFSRT